MIFCALQLPLIFWGLLKFMKIVTFSTICCVRGGNQGMGCRPGSWEHPHSVTAPSQLSFCLPRFAFLSKGFSCRVVWCDQPQSWFGHTSPGSAPANPEQPCGVWSCQRLQGTARAVGCGSDHTHPDLRSARREQYKYILDVCCFDFERGYWDE